MYILVAGNNVSNMWPDITRNEWFSVEGLRMKSDLNEKLF